MIREKHIVGSDKASLATSLSTLKAKEFSVPVTITEVKKEGTTVSLKYKSIYGINSRLNIVMLLKRNVTEVKRGENRNRTLLNTHIVLDKKTVTNSSISEVTFKEVNFNLGELEFVAYIQNNELEVTGATQWK